jgi:hypothetical protein
VPELTVVVPPTVTPIGIGMATLPIDIVVPPARYICCCIANGRPVKSWRSK